MPRRTKAQIEADEAKEPANVVEEEAPPSPPEPVNDEPIAMTAAEPVTFVTEPAVEPVEQLAAEIEPEPETPTEEAPIKRGGWVATPDGWRPE